MDPLIENTPYLTREENEVSSKNDEQNSADVSTPVAGNDSTWCVHVHGPDDVLPAADRHDAMRQAHALNASFIDHIASENPELSDYYPCMWAVATLRSNA